MEIFPIRKIKEIVTVKMEIWEANQGLNSLSRLITSKENQAGQVAGRENQPPQKQRGWFLLHWAVVALVVCVQ